MRDLRDGLDDLTAREAMAIIGCLQREIDLIERGTGNWSLYEEEYRSAAAKLRALVLSSIDALLVIGEYRDALGTESSGLLKQVTMPGSIHRESSAGPDRPTEANTGVENGNSAVDHAASI